MGATGIGGAGWLNHDLPGYDARRVCAKRRDCAQIAFLQVQLEFWDAAGPHDSELQELMDFMEGSACADALSALIPLAFCGRSQRCWRRDADFSFIAERRETLRLRGDARGCNGHRRRRIDTMHWSDHDLLGYTMPVAFARKAR